MKQSALSMLALTLTLTLTLSGGAAAANLEHGKQLLQERCTKCHDDSVYTRKDRFITSKEALEKQVSRCSINTGAQWFDDDIDDVIAYLNSTYYKFK